MSTEEEENKPEEGPEGREGFKSYISCVNSARVNNIYVVLLCKSAMLRVRKLICMSNGFWLMHSVYEFTCLGG